MSRVVGSARAGGGRTVVWDRPTGPRVLVDPAQAAESGAALRRAGLAVPVPEDAFGGAPCEAGPALARVCVPTCDRPPVLERCLRQLVAELRRWGRDATVTVIDDSRTAAGSAAAEQVVASLRRDLGATIGFHSRATRRRMADALADRAGLAPTVARAALLGPDEAFTAGACRNTAMLLHGATPVLMVDDDIVFRAVAPPGASRVPAVTSRGDPTAFWFYADPDEAVAAFPCVDMDLVGAYEGLLGRPSLVGRTVDFGTASPSAVSVGLGGRARVVAATAGLAGDSGMGHPTHLLTLEGPSMDRLRAGDAAALRSRAVVRACPAPTLAASGYLQTATCAVDVRGAAVPFPAAGRGEDTAFTTLLAALGGDRWIGHLPLAVHHRPPGDRAVREADLWRGVAEITPAAVLAWAHASLARPGGVGPRPDLAEMGARLLELAALPERAASAFVVANWRAHLAGIHHALRAARDRDPRPGPWRDEIVTGLARVEQVLVAPGSDRIGDFRSLFRDAGLLYGSWGRLLDAAVREGDAGSCVPDGAVM